jgi:hypothetical protein
VNVGSRFAEHIPDLNDVISRTRFVIDSLHIHDHIDKCTYTYSTEYLENTGHFHGVGVEQFWSVQNQSGPKTSQMNPGHRMDSITEDIGDLNWKKTVRLGKHGRFPFVSLHSHCSFSGRIIGRSKAFIVYVYKEEGMAATPIDR